VPAEPSTYPEEVDAWTEEVLSLPPDAPRREWIIRHPDGRRWVGLRVGVYLVDQAMRITGQTVADLVSMPAEDLIGIAVEP
jgi:hypothetical protein